MEDQDNAREQRGIVIAAKAKLQKAGDGRWFVPSQSVGRDGRGAKYYTVKPDPIEEYCSCPDFAARQRTCKHLFAVQIVIKREYTDDGEVQTLTETVSVRKSYKQ